MFAVAEAVMQERFCCSVMTYLVMSSLRLPDALKLSEILVVAVSNHPHATNTSTFLYALAIATAAFLACLRATS
jgi:hypothetical protein